MESFPSPSVDIYVVRDDVYPRIGVDKSEVYLILGQHESFINGYRLTLRKRRVFFSEYEIDVNDKGTLLSKLIKSSYRLRDRYVNTKEFALAGYPIRWTHRGDVLSSLSINTTKISIHNVLYIEASEWKEISLIFCPRLTSTSRRDVDIGRDFFLTNPLVLLEKYEDSNDLYKNSKLRSVVNSIIFEIPGSQLSLLLNHLFSYSVYKLTVLVNYNDSEELRLVRTCYDRNRLRAFTLAWFQGQLSRMESENEKVINTFELVSSLI